MGFFDKIKAGLKKTRDSITGQINSMLHAFTKIDEELFEELEELLVMADVGMNTATEICDTLRARVKERGITDPNEIMTLLQEVVTEMVSGDNELHLDTQPSVILVIGVNGVGKTTTKEMTACMLERTYRTARTEGNHNNNIGLPMTILDMPDDTETAVLELGMNHAGEIDYLSAIVEPDVVLMTNIGDSHIEHFGSREKILEAKSEVFRHARSDAFVVLNGDDPLLRTLPEQLPYPCMLVGAGEALDYRALHLESDGRSHLKCEVKTPHSDFNVEIPALGEHMIYPTLMAAAVGEHFGLSAREIASGVLHFAPTKMRMNILHRADGITILNDAYNANPQSMRAAVEVLSGTNADYKVAVLGDMFELGPLAPALHAGVGEYLGKAGIDCLVAVGELAKHIYDAAQAAPVPECYYCRTKEAAKPVLDGMVRPNATILVKASRGMAMEELVEYLLGITGPV